MTNGLKYEMFPIWLQLVYVWVPYGWLGSEHQIHMQSSCLCVSSMLNTFKVTETDWRTNVTALWHSHRTVETQNLTKNGHTNLRVSQTSEFSTSSALLTADVCTRPLLFLCSPVKSSAGRSLSVGWDTEVWHQRETHTAARLWRGLRHTNAHSHMHPSS